MCFSTPLFVYIHEYIFLFDESSKKKKMEAKKKCNKIKIK